MYGYIFVNFWDMQTNIWGLIANQLLLGGNEDKQRWDGGATRSKRKFGVVIDIYYVGVVMVSWCSYMFKTHHIVYTK